MCGLKVILTICVIASVQYFCFCNAENIFYRTKRGSGSWIFIDTDEDSDSDTRFSCPPPRRTSTKPTFTLYTPESTPPRTTPPKSTSSAPVPIKQDPQNPCTWELPKKPNFYTPGRRISEAKCDDFQWDLKERDERKKKDDACRKYRMEHDGEVFFGPAVVGGRKTEPGEFPHMAALGWRAVDGGWKFQCGATLISEKYLLTAAHCSRASSLDTTIANTVPEIVRLGVTNIDTWPKDRHPYDGEIAQITNHPQYASPKKYYDLALVELKSTLYFIDEYIRPACLWTRYDTRPLGNKAFATGWGYIDADGTQKAAELQAAEVNIIDSVQCNELYKPFWNRLFNGLKSHQLCAGVLSGGVDTCQGDSGGPLQVKIPSSKRLSYIIGVTSFGRKCASQNSPGVYTRVSSFIDWIENIVWAGQ